jgi:aspartyl-tRNA(Asn)/glutamyl-tRNA(Gln) amidotransferase subunit A
VASRIRLGANAAAADYYDMLRLRGELMARVARLTSTCDALLCPTIAIAAPAMAPLERDDDLYVKTNLAVLRNTTAFNFLDRCAISLPIHEPGSAAVGLMVVGEAMADRALFGIAAALERALQN